MMAFETRVVLEAAIDVDNTKIPALAQCISY